MYLCGICDKCTKPGQQRLVHTIYRMVPSGLQVHKRHAGHGYGPSTAVIESPPRREIAREVPICHDCAGRMSAGATFEELVTYHRFLARQDAKLAELARLAQERMQAPPPPPPKVNQQVVVGRQTPKVNPLQSIKDIGRKDRRRQ